jgi:hypothetical protein
MFSFLDIEMSSRSDRNSYYRSNAAEGRRVDNTARQVQPPLSQFTPAIFTPVTVDDIVSSMDELTGYKAADVLKDILRKGKYIDPSTFDIAMSEAIDRNYIFGYNGMYFNVSLIEPYLEFVSDDFQPLSAYVDDMMKHHNYQIECWILINNIEVLVECELLQTNNKLQIKKHDRYLGYLNGE